MMEPSAHQVTQLPQAWSEGKQGALDKLVPEVYEELRRVAQRYTAHERPGYALQTTALVNEAYLRRVDSAPTSWQNRAQFFAVCAQAIRRILVDWARSRQAMKRGGEIRPLKLDEGLAWQRRRAKTWSLWMRP
jgi:RNA polymerase sigma factor (TIGR02999 family)